MILPILFPTWFILSPASLLMSIPLHIFQFPDIFSLLLIHLIFLTVGCRPKSQPQCWCNTHITYCAKDLQDHTPSTRFSLFFTINSLKMAPPPCIVHADLKSHANRGQKSAQHCKPCITTFPIIVLTMHLRTKMAASTLCSFNHVMSVPCFSHSV